MKQMEKYHTLKYLKDAQDKKIALVFDEMKNALFIKRIVSLEHYALYMRLLELELSNTPKIYDLYEENDRLCVIEEYINLPVLNAYLDAHSFTYDDIEKIFKGLFEPLSKLHQNHIIHRDIKPENIFYDGDQVILFDFDIARIFSNTLDHDTHLLGSPGYAAPEQYGFGESSDKTDIYGLGMLIKYLINHKNYQRSTEDERLNLVIAKATQIDPDKRYRDINTFKGALIKPRPKPKKVQKEKSHPFALPGFRGKESAPKLMALIGYIMMIYVLLSSTFPDDTSKILIIYKKIQNLLIGFFVVLFFGNYLNIKNRCPFHDSPNSYVRLFGQILVFLILFSILGLIESLIANF